jgi:hypothetical protein
LTLRLFAVNGDSRALRNIQRIRELDGAGVREDECFSAFTVVANGVNCILHRRRVIDRSTACNSEIPRIEDSLGLVYGRLVDTVGNQSGSGGYPQGETPHPEER